MFYPGELVDRVRSNIDRYEWAKQAARDLLDAAAPWLAMSDDELWRLMFGPTITRSWMVWSNGHCPSCGEAVPMYAWEMDAFAEPWKVWCPHCEERFPKNDFGAFHESGLDEHGVFQPDRGDRSLLFNVDHPDPSDPLHTFGVDDGAGYVDGDKRWRFIGAWLIYGRWKSVIVAGIKKLAAAYIVTGDAACAHKAAVLLHRVADLHPDFDFGRPEQGTVYEGQGGHPTAGYVSTWHDACEETREMVLAYDQIKGSIDGDDELVAFLSEKARQYKLDGAASSADIRHHIEQNILQHAIDHRERIHSNYPRREIALMTILATLDWDANRGEIMAMLDDVLARATAVDGVTGEKGLSGYTCFTIRGLAMFLEQLACVQPGLLGELLERHPKLEQTWRFHIDTWCMGSYYPRIGDCGAFAAPEREYVGVSFSKTAGLEPSMFSFLWRLYELTGDAAYVQMLLHGNGGEVDGLPHELCAADADGFSKRVAEVIEQEGRTPKESSVNKEQWHLAILRSGEGDDARALWLDYDSGGGHSHADGLNLGLFAKGLDLLPDFGYPPVQYGGWGSPRAVWYRMTAAHNTVVVDGADQISIHNSILGGQTTLWVDGERVHAITVAAADLYEQTSRYERTALMVGTSDSDFYVVDVFRVVGGRDHAKFMHSHFGSVSTEGLDLKAAEDFGCGTQMRYFQCDPAPAAGWSVDWTIEDRLAVLPEPRNLHLRYTDLTDDAEAWLCEGWICVGHFDSQEEAWIPRVITRRRGEDGLATTFVGLIEPYEGAPLIASVKRIPEGPSDVRLEITLADGRSDLIVIGDDGHALGITRDGACLRSP